MFSKYQSQAPRANRTVPYKLRGLRNKDGTHPTVHCEHLGETNRPYWLATLAEARDVSHLYGSSPAEYDRAHRDERAERREKVIAYSARKLENVFRDDGTPATDSDIPNFIRAIPDVDFELLWNWVQMPGPFRDYGALTPPDELAEK